MDTKLLEFEDSNGFNESVTFAVRSAIEVAVLELITPTPMRLSHQMKSGHHVTHINQMSTINTH